ncbi:MAG: hypothetical protein HFJ09_15395 [Lachnospiraceae bacterium]|nr:hypothetical protein [Lachnospiraceae bacterium]
MKNRLKAEYIILKEYSIFFWILQAVWIIVAYNVFYICVPSVTRIYGGFYTSNILALLFVMGIFFPIFLGAMLGGLDYHASIMNYKLTNESQKDYIKSKLGLMTSLILAYVFVFFVAGSILDILVGTFIGKVEDILLFNLERTILVMFSWLVWGCISFFLAIVSKSMTVSAICCILIFYVEQFLNNYLPSGVLKYGIVWNQKSLLGKFFSDDKAQFGIVQSSFNSFGMACIIVVAVTIISILGSKIVLEKRYSRN